MSGAGLEQGLGFLNWHQSLGLGSHIVAKHPLEGGQQLLVVGVRAGGGILESLEHVSLLGGMGGIVDV